MCNTGLARALCSNVSFIMHRATKQRQCWTGQVDTAATAGALRQQWPGCCKVVECASGQYGVNSIVLYPAQCQWSTFACRFKEKSVPAAAGTLRVFGYSMVMALLAGSSFWLALGREIFKTPCAYFAATSSGFTSPT